MTARLCVSLATLTGCEQVILTPSTLHAMRDVYALFPGRRAAFLLDAAVYPMQKWMAVAAAGRTAPVVHFDHFNPHELRKRVRQFSRCGRVPVVGTDAYCTECGRTAPLDAYLRVIRDYNGWLVIDDTQALGLLGQDSYKALPWGSGGGGSLRFHSLAPERILYVASLAKGFGVPLALIGGRATFLRQLDAADNTRVHASPPSSAHLAAAQHALMRNQEVGDALRQKLVRRIGQFRLALTEIAPRFATPVFPLQRIELPTTTANYLFEFLRHSGLRTLRTEGSGPSTLCVNLIVTARHSATEIARVTGAIGHVMGRLQPLVETCYPDIVG